MPVGKALLTTLHSSCASCCIKLSSVSHPKLFVSFFVATGLSLNKHEGGLNVYHISLYLFEKTIRDRRQTSLLILSEFKQINHFLFPNQRTIGFRMILGVIEVNSLKLT